VGINLAINAAGVLILVAALWLARLHTGRATNARGSDEPMTLKGSMDEAA